MADLLVPRCGCEDCEAAVSPGAYLANLLDYVLKHVRNNGAKIDLVFVEKRLHQRFTELPLDCEAMDKKIHQVRLAVEVLRSYVGSRPLLEAVRETTLSEAEAGYRLATYTQLLTLLGTTHEEVRRARIAVTDDRTALAERLGIDLTPDPIGPRQDELDRLLLDPALPVTDERALTEQTLERVFGLGDTRRDPLSEGAKYGDEQQQITRWNLNGAYWNRNTDADGRVHLSIFKYDANTYGVIAYRDAARANEHVVASGERKTASGAIRLVPYEGSGLSGVVEIDYQADDVNVAVSVMPSMLVWRLRHLRTLWRREDWPASVPESETTEMLPPLIDPQVTGLSDLRRTRPGDAAYDLWLQRFNWLANQRAALQAACEAAATQLAGLEVIIALALSTPTRPVTVVTLDDLKQAQARGERIEQRLRPLGLLPGAFAFVMPILGLIRGGQTVTDSEWNVVYDTLVHARKQLEFTAWRTEEQTRKLTLSPDSFRVGDDSRAPGTATDLSIPFWLSTREARRQWMDVLEARIAQEAAVLSGFEDAVSSVEAVTLPILREALLVAADVEGSSLAERAEWLSQRLLIDLRMSGRQLTTRVAQAIETLQELLFSLRTGQLEQDTFLAFTPLESIYAVTQSDFRIDLFGRSQDDHLWHRVWNGRWQSWRSLGALPGAGGSARPSNPALVAHGDGRLDLIVRGSDRVLWHKRYDAGWHDWSRVTGDLEIEGNPAITLRGPGQISVVALRISDLHAMERRYNGTTWTAWEETGATSSRSPAVASWAADRLDLILGRHAPDLFKPLHRWWDGVTWQEEPLDNVLFSDPAVVSWGLNRLDVLQNFAGHLWQKSWDGLAWQPWVDLDAALPLGTPKLTATPSVYSRASGTLDVFALRSGSSVEESVWRRRFAAGAWSEWEVLPSDHLELEAPDFDAEWEWIGSYATWRSAMFVRLYPENLLHPSLITHQTPAFRELVQETRPTKRISPKRACELAQRYANYLRDVASLDIGATCHVHTDVNANDPCKTAAPIRKNLLFMFGRTTWGKVYWSAIDPKDQSGYTQSFWDEVPLGPKEGNAATQTGIKIIGALPWLDRAVGQHYIYLFLDVDERGTRKLKCMKFDLDRYGSKPWAGEAVELSVADLPRNTWGLPPVAPPIAVQHLKILPVQSDSVTEPPRLAIHQHTTTLYAFIRPLNATGDGWREGDWKNYEIEPRYTQSGFISPETVYGLEAALRVNSINWLVYQAKNKYGTAERHAFATVAGQSGAYICHYPSRFRGALPGRSPGSTIFLFYDDADQTVYREIAKTAGPGTLWPGVGTAFIPTPSLTTVAPHSGSFTPTFFVVPNKGSHSYAYRCQALNGELIGSSKVDVVPVLGSTTNIPVGEAMAALQARRISIKNVYLNNKSASASILTYLAEAYRLVPLQLALSMQSSREYVAALDWFMTVYDYRASQGERYIDYGLAIDAGLPDTLIYHHPENWLLDPLNPHAIASIRRYAYTRFTITSIIRCLNDFADAEFTTDTNESLVRARLLYTTALELCEIPEVQQKADVCKAIISALEIQPGKLVPPEVAAALGEIAEELTQGKVGATFGGLITLEKMKTLLQSGKAWVTIVSELKAMTTEAVKAVPVPFTTGTIVTGHSALRAKMYSGLLRDSAIERMAKVTGELAVAKAFPSVSDR